jgi:hypothetical protein
MTANQPYPGNPAGPPPSNNLVWAILTTIFCCLPFGIVSIVQAAKVNGLWASGQTAAAQEAAASAKKWAIIAAVTGIVLTVIYVVLGVAGVVSIGGFSGTSSTH